MEYLEAFERAIIYMENHLDEAVSVHEVAKASGYSYYHFTRIFQSVLGESIGNYLQKRRLSNATQKLLYSDRKIIDIAMESGFDSSEAFSRAFKSVYQISPTAYRNNRLDVFLGNKKEIDRDFLRHISANITVQPQIKKKTISMLPVFMERRHWIIFFLYGSSLAKSKAVFQISIHPVELLVSVNTKRMRILQTTI